MYCDMYPDLCTYVGAAEAGVFMNAVKGLLIDAYVLRAE